MEYPLSVETSVEELKLSPSRPPAVRETHHTLLDLRILIGTP